MDRKVLNLDVETARVADGNAHVTSELVKHSGPEPCEQHCSSHPDLRAFVSAMTECVN